MNMTTTGTVTLQIVNFRNSKYCCERGSEPVALKIRA